MGTRLAQCDAQSTRVLPLATGAPERRAISRPFRLAIAAQLVQIGPTVQTGIVPVVENDPCRIVADRLDRHDPDMPFARYDLLLGGGMALHFGAWRLDAKILGRQSKCFPVLEGDRKRRARRIDAKFHRPGLCHQIPLTSPRVRLPSVRALRLTT